MKVLKVFRSIFQQKTIKEPPKTIPPCPISSYDPDNVTLEEFQKYIHWLSKYGIRRTFREPQKFVTEDERKELEEFKKRIHYLSKNEIGCPFIC